MSPWALLDIAPTEDAAAIRRAYARKLRLTRPDEDPEGFQRLVQARDAALNEAAWMAERPWAEAESECEREGMRVLAPAERNDGPSAEAAAIVTEPVDSDVPPIVVREIGESVVTPVSAQAIPRIVVTEGSGASGPAAHDDFSLEASVRHWELARQLAARARRLLSEGCAPEAELMGLITASAALPRGPRQEVEAALIEAAGHDLRLPNAGFNRVAVDHVRALFRHGEAVFGWLRDDTLIHKILAPRDAAAFCLIGREEDDWRGNRRPRLPDSDARIMFAGTRKCMRVFERFRRRGRPAWHFDVLALPVPPLWAYYYRQTALAFAMLAALTTAGVLMMYDSALSAASTLAGAGIFLATCLATALLSDRLILWGAARTFKRARRELCYDPKLRADFLRREGQPREFTTLLIFGLFSSAFLTVAYVIAYIRLEEATTALAAWLGWW